MRWEGRFTPSAPANVRPGCAHSGWTASGEARILDDRYDIPAEFDVQRFFENAPGIWYTNATPVQVVLRFLSRAASRVKESLWHRGQKVKSQPDGSLLCTDHIAEPLEMTPWIRGYGADVEVLAPVSLRASLVEEAARLAKMCGEGKGTEKS